MLRCVGPLTYPDKHWAEDVTQEVMAEMLSGLRSLRKAERFWSWLRKIAYNTVSDGRVARRPMVENADEEDSGSGPFGVAWVKELGRIVERAMGGMKPRYRQILVMRCYEEMGFKEIASDMGCSEFAARMLLVRAKRGLEKQLKRNGFGQGSLLMALLVFGKLTAGSEAAAAAITVKAGALKAGGAATLAGTAGSATGVATAAAVAVVAVGAAVMLPPPPPPPPPPGNLQVGESKAVLPEIEGVWEWDYFWPDGPDGPMWTRLVQQDEGGGNPRCMFMANGESNYRFEGHGGTVRECNYRMCNSGLTVRRLPTDSWELTDFLDRVEGGSQPMDYVRGDGGNMWVKVFQNRSESRSLIQEGYQYEIMKGEYFRPTARRGANRIDDRNEMHRRGWTFFRIEGEVNGKDVTGVGRLPFVSGAMAEYGPWLRMQVGRAEYVDSGRVAIVRDGSGEVVAGYDGGSFFEGLSRPWMGLHTIDTVRRDAAEHGLWFQTQWIPAGQKVEIEIASNVKTLVYTIDLERDVVDSIRLVGLSGGLQGELRFDYFDELPFGGDEFVEPGVRRYGGLESEMEGLWLMEMGGK